MKTLSERIKSLRLPGETQSEFAERLGTTQASISRYINGRQPDRETLIRIGRRTGVSLDWLLTGKAERDPIKGKSEKEIVEIILSGLGELKSIPARERSQLQGFFRRIIENQASRKELLAAYGDKAGRRQE